MKTAKVLASVILAGALALFSGCAQSGQGGSQAESGSESARQDQVSSAQFGPAEAAPSTAGKLAVEGAQLVSESGQPVQLRGVSTHGLAWFPQYVNQQFFDELRQDWGANVVRLAMYTAEYGGYCTGEDQNQLEDLIRNGVEYAENADLYAVVDWHVLTDQDPNVHADAAIDFFTRMSAEFADANNVIYEICNEPNGSATWENVKAYAERVIPVIRANDPDAVIVVGTPTWSQDVDKAAADPLDFDNVMYSLHFYAATHQGDLREKMKAAVEGGLPVFVTEFGICDASGNGEIDYESADEWVRLMDSLDVSYICWNLSNKDESSALFKADCDKTSGFSEDDLSAEGKWLAGVLHESDSEGR